MKRTKFKKADAILTGDWHLQEKQSVARKDNFWNTQWEKVSFISELQKKHDCPVLHSGDLFDNWKPSPMLLARTLDEIPVQFYTIFGNHDLPQHNLELIHKCGIWVLFKASKINILPALHWGSDPSILNNFEINTDFEIENKQILVWHTMTYVGKRPWQDCTDPKASTLLRKYPQYDLILTGHNHKTFVEEHEGRLLVNPGSIFRLTADQENHKPSVFLWYAETNTVKQVEIPIKKDVITREHIEVVNERNERIDAFIESMNTKMKVKLSFEHNMESFLKQNKVKSIVKEIIYESFEK